MASLQFVIDSLCSKVTVEWLNSLVLEELEKGAFEISQLVSEIRMQDRSLDVDSARAIAAASLEDLSAMGKVSVKGGIIEPL